MLSPALNAHGTSPLYPQPLEVAQQLLSLGHPVSLVTNPEPDEMSHHTQTSVIVGFPVPAEQNWRSCFVLISSCSHLEGLRGGAMLVKTSQ